MSGRSLDQQRAAHALQCVDELQRDPKTAAKYVGYVKAMPAAILANGLGEALATELAAKDKVHDKLAEHVARWLLSSPGRPKGWDLPKRTTRTTMRKLPSRENSSTASSEAISAPTSGRRRRRSPTSAG